eukprot:scaffold16276_cov17-Prasinocladus_malaysianus.AAC.1
MAPKRHNTAVRDSKRYKVDPRTLTQFSSIPGNDTNPKGRDERIVCKQQPKDARWIFTPGNNTKRLLLRLDILGVIHKMVGQAQSKPFGHRAGTDLESTKLIKTTCDP